MCVIYFLDGFFAGFLAAGRFAGFLAAGRLAGFFALPPATGAPHPSDIFILFRWYYKKYKLYK
jgi:hypothetical protein